MIESYLLMGQSNMAGRGNLNEVIELEDSLVHVLRNGRWQPFTEPIHYDRRGAGVGPSASFAACLRAYQPEIELGLIPCADGGSSIDEWMKGEALYEHAVFQGKLAQRISTIKGILWHQGESDTKLGNIAVYKNKFSQMIRDIRKDLGLEEVDLFIGGLGDFLADCPINPNFKNYTEINEIFKEYVKENNNTYFVSAEGLKANPDLLHFDGISQRKFGVRYAHAKLYRTNIMGQVDAEEMYDIF